MSIKARFYVAEFNKQVVGAGNGNVVLQAQVKLNAVKRETDDNIQWAKYTPAGQITLSVSQEAGGAYEELESLLGKDVSVTFDAIPHTD